MAELLNLLFENPLPIVAVGGVCAIAAGLIAFNRRTLGALAAVAVVVLVTIALLVVEQMVVTDREQIESGLNSLLNAIEQNDLDGVLQWIDPVAGALVKADAEALMPIFKVETANAASTVVISIDETTLTKAVAQFKGFFNGVAKRGGARIAYFDNVELHWLKSDGQWRIASYVVYWEGKPINPVDSVRSNRPMQGR